MRRLWGWETWRVCLSSSGGLPWDFVGSFVFWVALFARFLGPPIGVELNAARYAGGRTGGLSVKRYKGVNLYSHSNRENTLKWRLFDDYSKSKGE